MKATEYIEKLDEGGEHWSNDTDKISDAMEDYAKIKVKEELISYSNYLAKRELINVLDDNLERRVSLYINRLTK